MILFSGLDSILESIYTGIPLTTRMANVDILVNPESITYLTNKICILTKKCNTLDQLSRNKNTIITRVRSNSGPDIIFDPYLPKIFEKISWNGDRVRFLTPEIYESIDFSYNSNTGFLAYPMPFEYFGEKEDTGELNSLGFILYQLGENLFSDTKFNDLDLVKMKKGWEKN